ncbi:hypothetical protein NKH77_23765 [Streptomyces sp. M19]
MAGADPDRRPDPHPWHTSWIGYGTLALTRRADGARPGGSPVRRVHGDARPGRGGGAAPGRAGAWADARRVRHRASPWAVAGQDLAAQFAVGLRVPGCGTPGTPRRTRRTPGCGWPRTTRGRGRPSTTTGAHLGVPRRAVRPRRLWDEVAAAYGQWDAAGRPGIERHGLDVAPDGTATLRLPRREAA